MLVLITDVETTGLPKESEMIEVAGCLYHVETKSEVAMAQCLLYAPENPVANINGITKEVLEAVNPATDVRNETVQRVMKNAYRYLYEMADIVLAHNVAFDKQFIERVFNRGEAKTYRCSKNDIVFPKTKNSRSLGYLAVDHGVWPFAAHRAMNDVLTLVNLCKLVPDLAEQLSRVPEEVSRWEAIDLPFEMNDAAKAKGFRFDKEKKVWWKEMKESETNDLSFRVQKPQ